MEARKAFLLVMLGVLAWISYHMVEPFLAYLVGAALIAFVLRPLHARTSRYIPERISAFLLVFLSVFLAIVPFLVAASAIIEDARDLGGDIENTTAVNMTEIEQRFEELTGRDVELRESIDRGVENFLDGALGGFSRVLSFVTGLTIGLTLMLFFMYYLVMDGGKLVEWIKEALPMEPEIEEKLFNDIERTTWAVMKGHVFVAIVQGLIAGLGLFLTGVPNYIFWTFVMVLLGFIPIIGSFVVWGPASVYLFLTGEAFSALFLALYGVVVVSLTDNVLRPFAVDRKADIHPAAILIGVIGGVYLFGAVGLFIGPIILGIFKSILVTTKNTYKDL
ncbi:MAG: AI-2E family transporter [Candidatus Nanohaloarchaea archaeon]